MLFEASEPIRIHFESSRTFTTGFVIALAPIGIVIMLWLRRRSIKRTVAIAKEAYRQVKATNFASAEPPASPGSPEAATSPAEDVSAEPAGQGADRL